MAADEQTDLEYTELLSFLSDPKSEVQKLAAEGVLGHTDTQEFLDYCHRHAKKVAKPLLRLVEKCEADLASAKSPTASASLEAREAGVAALQALVNVSAVPPVRDELIGMNVVRRCCEALRGGWLEGRLPFAEWYAMLLANVTTAPAGQEALINDESLFRFLFAAYVAKARPSGSSQDPFGCLGKVICNLCSLQKGRAMLGQGEHAVASLKSLTQELPNRDRRLDVLSTFRNVSLDKECHDALVQVNVIEAMARFMYPLDSAGDEKASLPEALREDLLAQGATLTNDIAVRAAAAQIFVGLVITEQGRNYLRTCGAAEILRAWAEQETDPDIKVDLETSLPAAKLSEEELAEEQKRIEVAPAA